MLLVGWLKSDWVNNERSNNNVVMFVLEELHFFSKIIVLGIQAQYVIENRMDCSNSGWYISEFYKFIPYSYHKINSLDEVIQAFLA